MTKKNRRVAKMRRVLFTLSLVLVTMIVAVGGTVAWLTSEGGTVTNTFSVGDINIELWEHQYDSDSNSLLTTQTPVKANANYKIVPGNNLPKDPYVIVKKDSEACWLFIQISETDWNEKLTYTVDRTTVQSGATTAWTQLDDVPGVYYMKVNATTTADTTFEILTGNTITVSDQIKKGEITGTPVLTFTAYACQQANVADAATAWSYIQNGGLTPEGN